MYNACPNNEKNILISVYLPPIAVKRTTPLLNINDNKQIANIHIKPIAL